MNRVTCGVLVLSLLIGGCRDAREKFADRSPDSTAQTNNPPYQPSNPPPSAIFVTPLADRPAIIPAELVPSETCSLDLINDQPVKEIARISGKSRFKFTGWAGNVTRGTNPQDIFMKIEGPTKAFIKATRGLKRPDVATYFDKPSLADSGWESFVDLSSMPAGIYKVGIIQVEGQSGLLCDTKRSIAMD